MLLPVACALMLHGPVALPAPSAPISAQAATAAPATWPAQAPDLVPPVRTAAVAVACLALLAVAGWLWRRSQLYGAGATRERIHLLASRSFGPKHRVAVIETCGERLLLALCDKDISVLSHLPCGSVASDEAPLPSTVDAMGGDVAGRDTGQTRKAATPERRFEVVP